MQDYPAESLKDLLNVKDPHSWGAEAYKIALDKIYSYTQKTKQITETYQNEIRPILMRQIALAGYRLADAIGAIYA